VIRWAVPFMSHHLTDPIGNTLNTELLANQACQQYLRQLNDFENEVFGPDFACDWRQIQPWIDSGCLFYSAIFGEAVAGQRRILSLASIFITSSLERDRLLLGQIADYELAPWNNEDRSAQSTIYFSAVVSDAPHHLTAMYECLLDDARAFRDARAISFHGAFGIATGPAGLRHMTRSGFRLLTGHRYRSKYDLMVIDAETASTGFWRGLLTSETLFLRRADAEKGILASDLPPDPILSAPQAA